MSDENHQEAERSPNRAGPSSRREGFELAKGIRSEFFSYLSKAAVASMVGLVGVIALSALGYVEWRVRQIVGGVPTGAVVAFHDDKCPEGWVPFGGGEMRTIIGATPDTDATDNTRPKPLRFNERRGEHAEYYLLTKATRPPGENEQRVIVPGVIALTYCKRTHQ